MIESGEQLRQYELTDEQRLRLRRRVQHVVEAALGAEHQGTLFTSRLLSLGRVDPVMDDQSATRLVDQLLNHVRQRGFDATYNIRRLCTMAPVLNLKMRQGYLDRIITNCLDLLIRAYEDTEYDEWEDHIFYMPDYMLSDIALPLSDAFQDNLIIRDEFIKAIKYISEYKNNKTKVLIISHTLKNRFTLDKTTEENILNTINKITSEVYWSSEKIIPIFEAFNDNYMIKGIALDALSMVAKGQFSAGHIIVSDICKAFPGDETVKQALEQVKGVLLAKLKKTRISESFDIATTLSIAFPTDEVVKHAVLAALRKAIKDKENNGWMGLKPPEFSKYRSAITSAFPGDETVKQALEQAKGVLLATMTEVCDNWGYFGSPQETVSLLIEGFPGDETVKQAVLDVLAKGINIKKLNDAAQITSLLIEGFPGDETVKQAALTTLANCDPQEYYSIDIHASLIKGFPGDETIKQAALDALKAGTRNTTIASRLWDQNILVAPWKEPEWREFHVVLSGAREQWEANKSEVRLGRRLTGRSRSGRLRYTRRHGASTRKRAGADSDA